MSYRSMKKTLSLEEKRQLIEGKEAGKGIEILEKEFSIGRSTIYRIIADKERILNDSNLLNPSQKRQKKSKNELLDCAIVCWLKVNQTLNIPINGPSLQAKAREFARGIGDHEFKASDGWLTRFKSRHSVVFKKQTR